MGCHPRIENKELASFLTTRCRNSELWFINHPVLENAILASAAKYTTTRNVKLYALAIEGNHIQGPAHFPNANRADFMRDFNSSVARAVKRLTPEYPKGSFWARRYSNEFLPAGPDIEDRFFYTVLQPVNDGLVEKISDYPGYNCFHDAIYGIERKFKIVRLKEYNAAKKRNPTVSIKDFEQEFTLKYERLPGYENLTTKEYAELMKKKLEEHRISVLAERHARGLFGVVGRETLLKTKRGSLPFNTKTADRNSHRPRVLSKCSERFAECISWYFETYFEYKNASRQFRQGNLLIPFPSGTYRPPLILKPPQLESTYNN